MHAIGSGVLVGFVAVAVIACGGDSKKNPQADGIGEAGAGSIDAGNTGAEDSGAASGTGGSSAATAGGSGGVSTTGGGAPSAGGMAAAGASPVADGSGGDTTVGSATGGGAASGGSSTVSGTGGADLIEPPPNCESVRQTEDAETCSYEYRCNGATHFDNCRRDSYGIWACECGTFSTAKRHFEIEGVEGLEACSVIARVCEGDVPMSTTRTCRPKPAVVQDDSCSSYATCGYALDLGPGISARAVDYFRAECVPREDPLVMESRFDCSCTGDSFATKNYLVTAPSIDDVCDPMREVCLAEGEPTFTERRCRDFAPAGTVEGVCPAGEDCQGCMIYRECGLVAPIAEEVSILSFVNLDYRYILCRPTQGELQCTCEASLYGVYSDESVPSEVLDVCRESSGVCPL